MCIITAISAFYISYHYVIQEEVIVTIDTLTAQRKSLFENVRKNIEVVL